MTNEYSRQQRAVRDAMLDAIPVIGPLITAYIDTQESGLPRALERNRYVGSHPYSRVSALAGMGLGGLAGPALNRVPRVGPALNRLNRWLFGQGHKVAPTLAHRLAGSMAGGVAGGSLGKAMSSYDYTMKRAFAEDPEQMSRLAAGYSPLALLLGSRAYIKSMPVREEIGELAGSLPKGVERFKDLLMARERVGAPAGRGLSSKGEVTKILTTMLDSSPGAYMDIDRKASPLARAIGEDLANTAPDLKGKRGLIFGGRTLFGDTRFGGKIPSHVWSHEMGHALQPRWLKSTFARMGLKAPMVASAAPLISDDEGTAIAAAGASNMAALPGLAGEIDASERGRQIFKRMLGPVYRRLGPAGKLAPYIGVPTYASALGMPWLAYGIRKAMGGYEE